MSKAIEDALKRASPEARAKAEQTIQEFRQNLSTAPVKDVNEIPTRSNAPSNTAPNPRNLENKQLDPPTQSNIENIQQVPGNNYLYPKQNAVEKAMSRPPKQGQKKEPEQDKER